MTLSNPDVRDLRLAVQDLDRAERAALVTALVEQRDAKSGRWRRLYACLAGFVAELADDQFDELADRTNDPHDPRLDP